MTYPRNMRTFPPAIVCDSTIQTPHRRPGRWHPWPFLCYGLISPSRISTCWNQNASTMSCTLLAKNRCSRVKTMERGDGQDVCTALSAFLWLRENTGGRVRNLNLDLDKLVEIEFVKVI